MKLIVNFRKFKNTEIFISAKVFVNLTHKNINQYQIITGFIFKYLLFFSHKWINTNKKINILY